MDSGELSLGGASARVRRRTRRSAAAPRVAPKAAPAKQNLYPPGVSIIICTYNRLPLLKKMIDSIRPQLPAAYPLEVLIVDNNSSDGTADYVRGLRLQDETFRYVLETKQGLSHARNGGARAARYDFLFYADDDAFLSPGFLHSMGEALGAHHPDLFGGPCLPDYVDPKPSWFPEALEIRRKAEVSGFYNHVTLSGSSFGIRRTVLERIGGFNPQFGMTGKRPGMLEERLAIEAYRRMTPPAEQKVYYSVESYVMHYTPASRMRVGFQLRRIYQANFNYIKYSLEQGVRTPALLASGLLKRLGSEFVRFVASIPAIWRTRESAPDRLMMDFVRVIFRIADAHAALHFLATDWGKTKKRLAAHVEDRPLEILLLHGGKAGKSQIYLKHAVEALSGHRVTICSTHGQPTKQLRAAIDQVNPRALDVIITDNIKAMVVCDQIRAHLPHLQVLLWARDPQTFGVAQRPWTRWRTPGQLFAQLSAIRHAARRADQVIWAATPRGRVARVLLGARNWVALPSGDVSGAWRSVAEAARIWAPRRLSP